MIPFADTSHQPSASSEGRLHKSTRSGASISWAERELKRWLGARGCFPESPGLSDAGGLVLLPIASG